MAIDKSGEFWKGNSIEDIKEYLIAYSEDQYPVKKVVISKCDKCNCEEFLLEYDQDEGVVKAVCNSCETVKYIADSKEYFEEAEPEEYECLECKTNYANVAVGLAYRENGDVKWVYVGIRCPKCGMLGSINDWKINYGPTKELEDNL